MRTDVREPADGILTKFDKSSLVTDLTKLIVSNPHIDFNYNIVIEDNPIKLIIITGRPEEEALKIDVFKYPVFFTYENITYCGFDIRHLCKYKEFEHDVRKMSSYPSRVNIELYRLILSVMYYHSPSSLSSIDMIIGNAMATWLTRTFQHAFGLDVHDSLNVEIAMHQYFHMMTLPITDYDDDYEVAEMRTIMSMGKGSNRLVKEFNNNHKNIENIDDLIEVLKELSPKFHKISKDTFITITSNALVIPNGYFVIVSGLEHYPTMITMVISAITDRINGRSKMNSTMGKTRELQRVVEFEANHILPSIL